MSNRQQNMDLAAYIKHPAKLDSETLYELRSMLALHPYFQTARLLMLQNLYLLHDPSFDEELRKTALYVTDRKTIFNTVESAHYQFNQTTTSSNESILYKKSREGEGKGDGYRERETPEGYCENTQNGPPQTNANVNYS